MSIVLSTDRYLDDGDLDSTRILFRAGFAPQSRELNAMQASFQRQLAAISDHQFKDGSKVVGGSIKHLTGKTLLIESTYQGVPVDLNAFIGKQITEIDSVGLPTGATGTVFAVSRETDTDPACLHFNDESAEIKIGKGHTVNVTGESFTANIRVFENPVRNCQFARLLSGLFYFDKKYVKVDEQLLVYSKFDDQFSGSVGIVFTKAVLTESEDPSLYDPARGYPNFNAPGAHREVYISRLSSFKYVETRPDNFVTLSELQEGKIKTIVEDSNLNVMGDIMARRTEDTNGSFVVKYFKADLVDHILVPIEKIEPSLTSTLVAQIQSAIPHSYNVGDTFVIDEPSIYAGSYSVREVLNEMQFTFDVKEEIGTIERNQKMYRTNYFGIQVSPGKAYVLGYENSFPGTTNLEIERARTVARDKSSMMTMSYGRFVTVENLKGMYDFTAKSDVVLRDASNGQVGLARVQSITNAAPGKWNLYLFNVRIDSGKSSSAIKKITAATGPAGAVSSDVVGDFNLKSSNSRGLIANIPNHEIATLQPENVPTMFYVTQIHMTQASSSNSATFALTGDQTFVGPREIDFKDYETFRNNYIVMKNDGTQFTPTHATISADGKTITIGTPESMTVVMRASINVKPAVKKKVKAKKTVTKANVNSADPVIDLAVADAFSVKITDETGDITNRFFFDDGQRDDMYDFGSVTLKTGTIAPQGTVKVEVEYFNHTGVGYFSVDSYTSIPYKDIPKYTFADTSVMVNLRNCVDFRYVRTSNGFSDSQTPVPDANLVFDFNYYLPRRDIVTISKNGRMRIVSGIPNMNPRYPTPNDSEIVIFKIHVNAYTGNYGEDVFVHRDQIIRYTMKDIGIMKKQIERLEYETSLSLLESSAKSENIVDENGNTRFKTGFLVDDFTGHGLGDTTSDDYRVSVDRLEKLIRPMFKEDAFGVEGFDYNGFIRVGNNEIGHFVMMPSTRAVLTECLIASKAVSVNPYLVTKRIGTVNMNPSSDYWKDTTIAPIRNVDMTADLENTTLGLGTIWNEWETAWTGSSVSSSSSRSSGTVTTTRTETKTGESSRTGTEREISFSTQTESIGSYLIDANVSYFMRAIDIEFSLQGMRPNTDIHVFIDSVKINELVESDLPVESVGSVRIDNEGNGKGRIKIPEGRFRTGERVITFSDEPNNVSQNATTETSFIFAASGMTMTTQETVIATAVPQMSSKTVSETKRVTETNTTTSVSQEQERGGGDRSGDRDPLAQAFFVSGDSFPNGLFVKDLTVYCKRKPVDSSFPLILQLRPSVNGYPHSDIILPFSEISIPHEKVQIPANVEDMNSILAAPTTVTLDVPIYLAPGQSFNIVALADNPEYECYMAEMGQKILGTENRIYQQPVLGSSFRSQNGRTWTAYQNETLMFSVGVCVFETNKEMSFNLQNTLKNEDFRFNVLNLRPQVLEFEDTRVQYEVMTRDSTTSADETIRVGVRTNTDMSTEKIIRANQRDVSISVKGVTADKFVCPFFDLTRSFGIAVHNIVNYFGLVRRNFTIESVGTGYQQENTVINVSGGGGQGAVIRPIVEDGKLIDLEVVNQGQGYTSAPTISVTGVGQSAIVKFSGFETDPRGGNAESRYISKVVTLEDGFETDQANVYLDISSPAGTDVKLYYRCKNESDEESILTKEWKEFTNSNKKTSVRGEFIETKFDVNLAYTSKNGATFENSNSIQVKIVLLSSNSSVVPKAKAFRLVTSL